MTISFSLFLLVVMAVNVPGFIQFDQTGLTQSYSLLNPYSIARMVFVFGISFVLLLVFAKTKTLSHLRHLNSFNLLLLFYFVLGGTSLLWPLESSLLGFYRIFEWFTLVYLFVYYISKIPSERMNVTLSKLIFLICFVPIVIVLVGLAVSPNLAYLSLDEATGTIGGRLGGSLFSPNSLGVMAGICFFYCMILGRTSGYRLLSLVMLLVLFFTYSRGALLGLVLASVVFVIHSRGVGLKLLFTVTGLLVACAIPIYSDQLLSAIARGQSSESLMTASERTSVWLAGWQMFQERPLTGYGYITGTKNHLGNFMAATHWVPKHVHNDFLQALLSGGVFAGIILCVLYVLAIKRAFILRHASQEHLFVLCTTLQIFVYSLQTPVLSTHMTCLGAILVAVFFFLRINVSRAAALPGDIGGMA